MLVHQRVLGEIHELRLWVPGVVPVVNNCSPVQVTLWLFNIAMENGPFMDEFPIKTSIYKRFSMATLNNQRVHQVTYDMPKTSTIWRQRNELKKCERTSKLIVLRNVKFTRMIFPIETSMASSGISQAVFDETE